MSTNIKLAHFQLYCKRIGQRLQWIWNIYFILSLTRWFLLNWQLKSCNNPSFCTKTKFLQQRRLSWDIAKAQNPYLKKHRYNRKPNLGYLKCYKVYQLARHCRAPLVPLWHSSSLRLPPVFLTLFTRNFYVGRQRREASRGSSDCSSLEPTCLQKRAEDAHTIAIAQWRTIFSKMIHWYGIIAVSFSQGCLCLPTGLFFFGTGIFFREDFFCTFVWFLWDNPVYPNDLSKCPTLKVPYYGKSDKNLKAECFFDNVISTFCLQPRV